MPPPGLSLTSTPTLHSSCPPQSTAQPDPAYLITANPDIAGRGVRYSIYVQVILSIIIALLAALDGKITKQEKKSTKILPLGNLMVSSSVAGTALGMVKDLNGYHAIIILSTGFILEGPLILTAASSFLNRKFSHWLRDCFDLPHGMLFDAVVDRRELTLHMVISRTMNLALGIAACIISAGRQESKFPYSLKGVFEKFPLTKVVAIIWLLISVFRFVDVVFSLPDVYKIVSKEWPEYIRTKFQETDAETTTTGEITTLTGGEEVHQIGSIKLGVILVVVVLMIANVENMIWTAMSEKMVSRDENSWGYGQVLAMCMLISSGINVLPVALTWIRDARNPLLPVSWMKVPLTWIHDANIRLGDWMKGRWPSSDGGGRPRRFSMTRMQSHGKQQQTGSSMEVPPHIGEPVLDQPRAENLRGAPDTTGLVLPSNETGAMSTARPPRKELHQRLLNEQNHLSFKKSDVVILVTGLVGAGKSTFINDLLPMGEPYLRVGDPGSLETCTTSVEHRIIHRGDKRLVVVDTQGFDQYATSDQVVLKEMTAWLGKSFPHGVHYGGVIYLHDISSYHYKGISAALSAILGTVLGERKDLAYRRVILATTKWTKVDPNEGHKRQKELESKHWRRLIAGGAKVYQVKDRTDAWRILDDFLNTLEGERELDNEKEL